MKRLNHYALWLLGAALWLGDGAGVFAAAPSPDRVLALAGMKQTNHQYYDIPAWNANGSILLILGAEQAADGKNSVRESYLVRELGSAELRPFIPANDRASNPNSKRNKTLQWDAKDPDLLYYVVQNEAGSRTMLHQHNVLTNTDQELVSVPGNLTLAVPHPDGDHLLLIPGLGEADDVQIVSIRDRKATAVRLPAPVHRVRFTKAPDLSVFCNTQAFPRVSFFLDISTGEQRVLVKGNANHPDWSPDGARLSYFDKDGLTIMDAHAKLLQHIQGLGGHQSWSQDGRFIVLDAGRYKGRDSTGKEKTFAGYISMIEMATGKMIPLVPHHSKSTKDQNTHPHPHFSPDGTKVVFNSNNNGLEEPQAYVIKARDPDPVKSVTVTREGAGRRISWEPPQAKETKSFVVYRIASDGQSSVLAETVRADHSYLDSNPSGAKRYGVAVKEFSGFKSPIRQADGPK